MKNICFLVGNINNSGGTERVTSLIANELCQKNFNVTILSLFEGNKPFFPLSTEIQTNTLYEKQVSFKTKYIGCVMKLRRFLTQYEIEILIVVDSISCIFTIPALLGLNVQHICWEHFNFLNNNGSRLRDLARKLAVKYCDIIVTLTKRDQELWKSNLTKIKAKLITISNPCSFENIINKPTLEDRIILAVGRLTPVKGFDLLINAWAKICNEQQGWVLRIVGDGEDKKDLVELANSLNILDKIDFVGKTNNIESFYKSSSILCLSSRHEGLPMVLLEAQAFGLPIVAFDCDTGPAEIVNSQNGYLVENGNIEKMSESLYLCMNNTESEYDEKVKNAFLNAKAYSLENIIKLWMKIL